MFGFIPVVAAGLALQAAAGDPVAKDGVVRVQLEGTLGTVLRAEGKDAAVGASVLAGGGEFHLDLRGCADARKRLAAYADKARRSAFVVAPRVKVSGRLEFRPSRVIGVDDLGKDKKEPGVPGPPVAVLVVDSLSLTEPDGK